MNITIQETLMQLRTDYLKLAWHQSLFFPEQLSNILNQKDAFTAEDAWDFCDAYSQQTNLFPYVFSDLADSYNGSLLPIILKKLKQITKESVKDYFCIIVRHEQPSSVLVAFSNLHQWEMFTVANATVVAKSGEPEKLADALRLLQQSGDLAQTYHDIVINSKAPRNLALALTKLYEAKLLVDAAAQIYSNALVEHLDPNYLADAILNLHHAELLTNENFEAVANHENPYSLSSALISLHDNTLHEGEFAVAIREALTKFDEPSFFVDAIIALHKVKLLTDANFNAVANHKNPSNLSWALIKLHEADLLTGEFAVANREALTALNQPLHILDAFEVLRQAGLFAPDNAQEQFNVLLRYASILLDIKDVWNRIPAHQFTLEHFNAMITIAETHQNDIPEGQRQLQNYVNRQLLNDIPLAAGELNQNQSTHTASVHCSVSQSAKNLLACYRKNMLDRGMDKLHTELSTWCNQTKLPENSSLKQAQLTAARTCLERILGPDYHFEDTSSQVSTQQLLVLFWLAIHDQSRRQGTLEDAQVQLIEGLYEIQRGYNLTEQGIDEGGSDRPICSAGTFNKLVEKLNGIHSEVEVLFITHEVARLKFPNIVKEEAETYLKHSSLSNDAWEKLKEDGVEVIWEHLKPKVEQRILDEFSPIYEDRKNTKFNELMAQGIYVDIDSVLKKLDFNRVNKIVLAENPYSIFHQEGEKNAQYQDVPKSNTPGN